MLYRVHTNVCTYTKPPEIKLCGGQDEPLPTATSGGGRGRPRVDVGVPLHLLDELPVLPRDGVVLGAVGHRRPPERLVREPLLGARVLRRRRVQRGGGSGRRRRRQGGEGRGRQEAAERARQHSGRGERRHCSSVGCDS